MGGAMASWLDAWDLDSVRRGLKPRVPRHSPVTFAIGITVTIALVSWGC